MRRYATIAISLIAGVVMISAVFARIRSGGPKMPILFHKRDLPDQGIRIVTPFDSSFDVRASEYFKRTSPETLKPLSVFIENSSSKTIVAYLLTWKFAKQDGQIMSNSVGYSEPGVLMGDPVYEGPTIRHTVPIKPNAVRCFTWDSQILEDDPSSADSQRTSQQMALRQLLLAELDKATDVTVTIEGAVFDDGEFVGSNLVFFQQIKAVVDAKVDLLSEVEKANQRGKPDEAFESIKAKSKEPDVPISQNFSADEYYRSYRKTFASEITAMADRHGHDKVAKYLLQANKQSRRVFKKK